jgi:hypothetical protein
MAIGTVYYYIATRTLAKENETKKQNIQLVPEQHRDTYSRASQPLHWPEQPC